VHGAVLRLLSEGQPLSSLTVSEVAALACVTRKTLYARFGSLEQVVKEIAYEMFVKAASSLTDELLTGPAINRELSALVFRALREDQQTLQSLMTQCPSSLIIEPSGEVFRALLDRVITLNRYAPLTEFERDYLTAIVGSTIHGMVLVWIEREFVDSAEELAQLFGNVMGPGFELLLQRTSQ